MCTGVTSFCERISKDAAKGRRGAYHLEGVVKGEPKTSHVDNGDVERQDRDGHEKVNERWVRAVSLHSGETCHQQAIPSRKHSQCI